MVHEKLRSNRGRGKKWEVRQWMSKTWQVFFQNLGMASVVSRAMELKDMSNNQLSGFCCTQKSCGRKKVPRVLTSLELGIRLCNRIPSDKWNRKGTFLYCWGNMGVFLCLLGLLLQACNTAPEERKAPTSCLGNQMVSFCLPVLYCSGLFHCMGREQALPSC